MGNSHQDSASDTAGGDYTRRLQDLGGKRWKQMLDVQAPYRWNIRRLKLGRTLDIGCGLGRNLAHLGGDGVGVDHNPESVAVARSLGLVAYTTDEFPQSSDAVQGSFDALLIAHVIEHMSESDAVTMVKSYLPFLGAGGRICLITPQPAGYRSDSTHVRFVDFDGLAALCRILDFDVQRRYSFPLPRFAGGAFRYNEFVVLGVARGGS